MKKPLTIYKASAGSGKTHKLTEEYLKLVFDNPKKYKKILAVTFTNKATEEMKFRILSELFNLANGNKNGHYKTLMNEFKWLDDKQIVKRARLILQFILYNYYYFDINTIDSFFQKITKNFAREIGIQYGYNVELDTQKIIDQAIDKMLDDVGKNEKLTKWLTDFALENIEDDKTWNLRYSIKSFASEILKEDFQENEKKIINKIEDKKFLKEFISEINKIISVFDNKMKDFGKLAVDVAQNYGLEAVDFSGGQRSFFNYFIKIQNKDFEPTASVLKVVDEEEKWYAKKTDNQIKENIQNAFPELNKTLKQTLAYYNSDGKKYSTAISVKKYFNVLGIITDIASKIAEIRDEENTMLISDVNPLLNKIIDNNDTPFIYEKTGNKYHHFLIDEFQDTSLFQWKNIKPLMQNNLDQNKFSLVVGDVKQSIYRWRGGNWKLLVDGINQQVGDALIKTVTLEKNWRSEENIIKFNNSFFTNAAKILQQKFNNELEEVGDENLSKNLFSFTNLINEAYKDSCQKFPEHKKKNKGYVNVKFYENIKGKQWRENVKTELPEIIDNILDKGYKEKDITILVRNAKDGRQVADLLFKMEKYNNIISKDSLFLNTSVSVKIIVCALKFLIQKDDKINLVTLVSEYLENRKLKNEVLNDIFLKNRNQLIELLPDEFKKLIKGNEHYSLYDLTEKIIESFLLNNNKTEFVFIQAFSDVVLEYSENNKADISSFLDWWKENAGKKTIHVPESIDAIQIMSIHKSKGLGFKVVIIPYCDWEIDHTFAHDNILWCKSEITPFNEIDILPIKYGKKLTATYYNNEFFVEKLHAFMDNLNLLYVAFTRTKEALFILSPEKKKKISSSGDLLHEIINGANDVNLNSEFERIDFSKSLENKCFEFGELMPQSKDESKTKEYVLKEYLSKTKAFKLRIKREAEELFEETENERTKQINYGKFMHEVLSKIYTVDDVEPELKKLLTEGIISSNELNELKNKLITVIEFDDVKEWFTSDWEVKNESSIITSSGDIRIPDRVLIKDNKAVVIDFKFGEENEKYKEQVSEYMKYLKEMKYENVSGWLYYVERKKVVGVGSF